MKMHMKKKLLTVYILILLVATISCKTGKLSGESYMAEDVFIVGEGVEVKISIVYERKSFEIILTVSNVEWYDKTVV